MSQSGDGSSKVGPKVDEVRHDQLKADDAELSPRIWVQRFRQWRESVRSRPSTHRMYRAAVGLLGALIAVVGLLLVPLPGPGWLIVFVGLAVLATEFTWAARLENFARKQVSVWTTWVMAQPIYVRALVGLATTALVVGFFWAAFLILGVPSWFPAAWIPAWTGLESNG